MTDDFYIFLMKRLKTFIEDGKKHRNKPSHLSDAEMKQLSQGLQKSSHKMTMLYVLVFWIQTSSSTPS